jgi:peptidoglycan/LPS O-acetylase OafA/YrhL
LGFIEKQTAKAVILTIASVILYQANNTALLPYNQTMIWLPVAALAVGVYAVPYLTVGPAALLGRISYCMYLVHDSLGRCLLIKLGAFPWLPFGAKVAIAIAAMYCVAALLYYAIELPAAAWLRSLRTRIKAETAPSSKPLVNHRPIESRAPLGDRRQVQPDIFADASEFQRG